MKKDSSDSQAAGQKAWVLDFGSGFHGAVAFHEMSQVVMEPHLFEVPCTLVHAYQVIILRNRILPVLNMVSLLSGEYHREAGETAIAGIAVYQKAPYAPLSYGGFHLASTPVSVLVGDKQFCELPNSSPRWDLFTLSCFSHEGRRIPVLDLPRLFSAELREQIA
jgi:chemotaxis signal transduction protein